MSLEIRTHELRSRSFTIKVEPGVGTEWSFSCTGALTIDPHPLKAHTMEEAKPEALGLVRKRLADLVKEADRWEPYAGPEALYGIHATPRDPNNEFAHFGGATPYGPFNHEEVIERTRLMGDGKAGGSPQWTYEPICVYRPKTQP